MVIEEGERFARLHRFEPEADFGTQFDGHGVDVHAIDAMADDFAEGVAKFAHARFVAFGAWQRETASDALRGGDEEMPLPQAGSQP